MNKILPLIIIGIFIGGCGGTAVNNNATPLPEVKSYNLEEVAKHGKQGDCWIVIARKVYDISLFSEHPGGKIILEACGKEATELFNTKGDKGKAHSEAAKALLNKFYIGDLK